MIRKARKLDQPEPGLIGHSDFLMIWRATFLHQDFFTKNIWLEINCIESKAVRPSQYSLDTYECE